MNVNEEKIILDFLKNLCLDSEGYLNTEFGSDHNKLYIDSCLTYPCDYVKELVQKWLKKDEKEIIKK